MLSAEDWLKENCEDCDYARAEDDGSLNDFINTSGVIRYMKRYAEYVNKKIK